MLKRILYFHSPISSFIQHLLGANCVAHLSPGKGETFVNKTWRLPGAGSGQLGEAPAGSIISRWRVRGGKRKVEQTGVRKIWDAQGGDGDRFLVAIWWSKSAL